jgi:predicted ABC-type sugar transport system permease subunit
MVQPKWEEKMANLNISTQNASTPPEVKTAAKRLHADSALFAQGAHLHCSHYIVGDLLHHVANFLSGPNDYFSQARGDQRFYCHWMTYVIVAGGIDLSLGSVVGLAGMVAGGLINEGLVLRCLAKWFSSASGW